MQDDGRNQHYKQNAHTSVIKLACLVLSTHGTWVLLVSFRYVNLTTNFWPLYSLSLSIPLSNRSLIVISTPPSSSSSSLSSFSFPLARFFGAFFLPWIGELLSFLSCLLLNTLGGVSRLRMRLPTGPWYGSGGGVYVCEKPREWLSSLPLFPFSLPFHPPPNTNDTKNGHTQIRNNNERKNR